MRPASRARSGPHPAGSTVGRRSAVTRRALVAAALEGRVISHLDSRVMRMRRCLLAVVCAALVACGAAAAASPPPVVAPAYIVRGGPGATVLAARSPDVERAPASMTKLMTVLVALEHARLSEVVTVSPLAARVGESSVNLRAGERLTVHDLAIAALVPSANDAATALAAYVGRGSIP